MRKTCNAGEITEFKFGNSANAYRVKNFTNGAVYHTYKPTFVLDEASKIMSNFGEDTKVNSLKLREKCLTVQVRADIAGEVEVQPIDLWEV